MRNILVSACLLGMNCRYNGEIKPNEKVLELLKREDFNLIPVCPEQMGGLATPRDPAEIQKDEKVVTINGKDVTMQYRKGAAEALKMATLYHCDLAILKERSPSCGHGYIHDGSFSGPLIEGDGITVRLLTEYGVRVLGESELEQI